MDDFYKFGATVSPIVVSVMALFVACYNAWSTRRHSRLTVQPRLTTFTNSTDKDENTGVSLYKLVLRNSGLGPAFIKKFEVLYDGQAHEPKKPEEFYTIVSKALKVEFAKEPRYFAVLRVGHVVSKDEEQALVDIGIVNPPTDFSDKLKLLHLRITFESAYGVIDCYDTRCHVDQASDLSDLHLAARLFYQRLRKVAFYRIPILRLLQ